MVRDIIFFNKHSPHARLKSHYEIVINKVQFKVLLPQGLNIALQQMYTDEDKK